VHKSVRRRRKNYEDGGRVVQQRDREVAEEAAQQAAETGDACDELLAEGARYALKEDYRRSAKAYREAIALRPDEPAPYYNLGRAVMAAPDHLGANLMRATVLNGQHASWEAGPRSAAEFREAAAHFDRAAALCPALALKADYASNAAWCRRLAEAT